MSVVLKPDHLETARLLLRGWREEDVKPFAGMNADPNVMEHFPSRLTLDETKLFVDRIVNQFAERNFGLWAVELKSSCEFIGFVGLLVPTFDAHFTPCVEVGWRIAKEHWGSGYAPEAALEAMRDGFERIELDEIVSMTATTNKKSIRVMEKIGMLRNPEDDFDHPRLPDDHLLRRHVLYRLSKAQWSRQRGDKQ
jgi:RimJ/RimL family protein N-acetyltransferase